MRYQNVVINLSKIDRDGLRLKMQPSHLQKADNELTKQLMFLR